MVKVTYVDTDVLRFDDGSELSSYHDQDCCEHHYLHLGDLTLLDFEGLDFDLSSNRFFEEVDGYGIRLLPENGQPISVPGYGSNNGCYSSNLSLVLDKAGSQTQFDISECQVVTD